SFPSSLLKRVTTCRPHPCQGHTNCGPLCAHRTLQHHEGGILSDPTRHCRYFLRADQAAVAAWLALAACCPPSFAQDTSPVQATAPQPTSGSLPQDLCGAIRTPVQPDLLPVAPVVLPGSPVLAQSSLNPPEEKPPEVEEAHYRTSHHYVLQSCLCRHRQISAQSHKRGGLADGSRQAALLHRAASRVQPYRGPYGTRGAGTAGFTTGVEL